ncbi:MAG: tetratricopeptide repeat protein [Gemmatimonadaceae bacterium]|nr:tetratricopeptide repeat protein [Gemmatimonadaceae bacterium]
MSRCRSLPLAALTLFAVSAHAQSLADARTCERAITGSATDRAAISRMAAASRTSPVAHFAAGCAHVMAAAWDSAAIRFDAAAKGNPRSSAAFLWVGNITGQLARISPDVQAKVRLAPKIRDAYTTAIALDGNNIDAREGLMQFLLDAPAPLGGDKAKAAEQALAITRIHPYRGLSAQITVAASKRDNVATERLLASATTQFPDSVLGWANLSAMQADANRPAEAFATISRWQARRSHAMFALFSLGRTAAVTGQQLERGEQALKQYLRGPRGPNDPPVANANYRLGQIYERQKRTADARAAYQLALRSNPTMRDAQTALDRVK